MGDKKLFAVDIDVLKFDPWIWGKTSLWINNHQIGNFNDENILGPFIKSIERIALRPEKFWVDELDGLECKELFYKVFPVYNEPDHFYDLTGEEQKKYVNYDIFIFHFGENFDDWGYNFCY